MLWVCIQLNNKDKNITFVIKQYDQYLELNLCQLILTNIYSQ